MSEYRIGQAAELLGVSPDTVRRWADAGDLPTTRTGGGHRVVDGAALADFAVRQHANEPPTSSSFATQSTRNRFVGIVTDVKKDTVMAQVELQCGPYRVVSLISREAADELQLERGSLAVAAVKATNVTVEVPT